MNPFTDKSLEQLRDMAPGLANAELDALCATVCDGEWVEWSEKYDELMSWQFSCHERRLPFWHLWSVLDYTTDGREAMRLLVKYRLDMPWGRSTKVSHAEFLRVLKSINQADDTEILRQLCRAITETAVVRALTQAIERDGE